MLRALVMSILGWRVVVGLRSTSRVRIPRRARSRASVIPTGPAPAMMTGTWIMLDIRYQISGIRTYSRLVAHCASGRTDSRGSTRPDGRTYPHGAFAAGGRGVRLDAGKRDRIAARDRRASA